MKNTTSSKAFCLFLFILILLSESQAQTLTSEEIKTIIVKDWERAKAYTVDYLNAMPADKYSFKPVDSIRSFAQQMIHLAQSNIFLMSNATDLKPLSFSQSDLEHSSTAQTKDSVMYYVTTSYDFCIQAVKNSDINKWGEKKKLFSFEETRFAFMMKTFEHQSHHRGQTTIYIRLQGIRPPTER
jgi:uncharacterized damage-inducible protein DinB